MEQRVTTLPPNGFQVHISNRFLTPYASDVLNFLVPEFATPPNEEKSFRC